MTHDDANVATQRGDRRTLNDCERHVMLPNELSNVANANTHDANVAPATNVQHTMQTNVIKRDDNATRIEKLLSRLHREKNRNAQKKLRRALRALNHFGGRRERSSRYVEIDDKNRVKINRDAIRERAKRIASQNERDANVDE